MTIESRALRAGLTSVCLVALAGVITFAHVPPAEAGRKGVSIGLGVAAAVIIANQLASKKAKGKSAYSSGSSGKKKHASKERKSTSEKKSDTTSRKSKNDGSSYASRSTSTGKKSRYAADGVPSRGKGSSAGTAKSYEDQRSAHTDDGSADAEGKSADVPAREVSAAPPTVTEQGSSIPTDGKLAVAPPAVVTGATALARPAIAAPAIISTPSEIVAAQEHLRYLGYDVSAISGVVDPATRSAVMKYQQSLGAPATGDLTVEQLQALFKTAAQRQAGGT